MAFCKVLFLNTQALCDRPLFDFWYSAMPSYRKEKIDSYNFESGKNQSLGCGILLKKASEELGLENAVISVTENGKPFFSDYKNIHFSLSHSGEMAMCAISDVNVGCDIEKVENARMSIAQRFYSKEEQTKLNQCESSEIRNLLFYDIWTAKESYSKALGLGLKTDFEKINSFSFASSIHRFDIQGYSNCVFINEKNIAFTREDVTL